MKFIDKSLLDLSAISVVKYLQYLQNMYMIFTLFCSILLLGNHPPMATTWLDIWCCGRLWKVYHPVIRWLCMEKEH